MKTITRAAILAVTAASIGAASLAPAFAQPAPGGGQHAARQAPGIESHAFRPGQPGHFQRGGGLIDAIVSARSAEAIDVAATRLTHQLDLTEDQQSLLEALRLAAQDAYASTAQAREAILPVTEEEAETPDLVARYAGIVAMTTARAESLEALQPAFEAFVSSLDDEQIAGLTPQPRANR